MDNMSGFTREELGFGLWYLCDKKLVGIDNRTQYEITCEGVDYVESRLADDRPDLRAIAGVQIPRVTEPRTLTVHL